MSIDEYIQEIFRLDGTYQYFQEIVEKHEAWLELDRRGLSPCEIETQERYIDVMFRGPEFGRDYTHAFKENFQEEHAKATLEWLQDPAMRRLQILDLENFDTLEANQFLNSLEALAITQKRVDLLKRYSGGCDERNIETIVNSQLAEEVTRNRRRPPSERMDSEDLERLESDLKEYWKQVYKDERCWIPLKYSFREVSDAELIKAITFMESESGLWYDRARSAAAMYAFVSGGMRLGLPEGPSSPCDLIEP